MKTIASAGLLLAVAGCLSETPAERSSTVAATSTVAARSTFATVLPVAGSTSPIGSMPPDSLRDDLVEYGLRVPKESRQKVIAVLGGPDSVRSVAEANRYDPAMSDSLVVLYYPGLRLDYLVVGGKKDLLQEADVSDNRYLKYPTVGVGASAANIIIALGPPRERTGLAYSYECGRCIGADEPVIFHLAGGRVTNVEYQFYVD
jgi:hypothetical protein